MMSLISVYLSQADCAVLIVDANDTGADIEVDISKNGLLTL